MNCAHRQGPGSVVLLVVTALLLVSVCAAQTTSEPANQVWATVNASFELSERTRITALFEKHNGEEDSLYGQKKVGALFTYRMTRLGKHLTGDIDKENQYNLILGAGCEFIMTDDNGRSKREHRLVVQSTPKYVFWLGILAQDRNRLEFRWTGDTYNFRYRNRLTIERPFRLGKLRLSPYAAGELFWDRNHHAWNENQYAFGVQWPIKRIFKLNTYYLRQNCTTCSTDPLNVFGLTANFYFEWPKKKVN
jgi:hypothetical protein